MLRAALASRMVSLMRLRREACRAQTMAATTASARRGGPSVKATCRSTASAGQPTMGLATTLKVPEQEEEHEHEQEGETEGEDDVLEELSEARHVFWEDNFLPSARDLRAVFNERFADPRTISPERFLWDYWHIPEQYTLLRTQAQVYFPPDLYEAVENSLLQYGEACLGCPSISPIWMSYYVDGCSQELHCDNPHGPFAFVLSLTEWDSREFRGGETMILQPQVLDYWSHFDPKKGLELKSLVTLVEPVFNRLTVFDPRLPHGVRPVTGTRDPRKARLVLHGWFTEPSPFFSGGLTEQQAGTVLSDAMEVLFEALAEEAPATGTLIVRLGISGADGSVTGAPPSVLQRSGTQHLWQVALTPELSFLCTGIEFLADTVVPLGGRGEVERRDDRARIHHHVRNCLLEARFPPVHSGENSSITLPVIFE